MRPTWIAALVFLFASPIQVSPSELKWVDGPSSLPRGAKVVVIEGDPATPNALFTLRLHLPAGYRIPAHFHPADEHVTVLSGSYLVGMGDSNDAGRCKVIATGGYSVMPASHHHFAVVKEDTVIQVHAMGPWGITYLNSADDPRQRSVPGTIPR